MFLCRAVTQSYQHILALVFAIKEVNENLQILPNVTLGFHIYDSYSKAKWTYEAMLQLTSTKNRFIPNYKCDTQDNLIAVTGGLCSETSYHIANIMSLYKIPQVWYLWGKWIFIMSNSLVILISRCDLVMHLKAEMTAFYGTRQTILSGEERWTYSLTLLHLTLERTVYDFRATRTWLSHVYLACSLQWLWVMDFRKCREELITFTAVMNCIHVS